VPVFYRVGASLLTTAREIEVVGGNSSGEVEFVLVSAPDALYVGVGSDHTDRKVETYGVTVSKQMCPKPLGAELWPLAEVDAHWDRLVLRSHVTRDGERRLYQEGAVSRLLAPRELLGRFSGSALLAPGTAMFCGTLAVLGDIGGGERFEIELHDPVKNRSLRHGYAVRELAIAD
jgi:2-keto-4-pentenoate hydratase/2-oxohepta-3-ene-1,7-dioic acid hydratase in catechol pathway